MSILIENVSFSYPDKQIFSDFSKQFYDGIFYSVTAPSGKGKTTLFRLISGLEKPSSGTIKVNGSLSYMFQEDRLFPNLTVIENVKLAQSGEFSAEEMLEELGLYDERESYPDELSGGMKRRTALIRALLAPSQNIILDEPFTGLDDIMKFKAISLITRICKSKTLLISTHDDTERAFCDENITI